MHKYFSLSLDLSGEIESENVTLFYVGGNSPISNIAPFFFKKRRNLFQWLLVNNCTNKKIKINIRLHYFLLFVNRGPGRRIDCTLLIMYLITDT